MSMLLCMIETQKYCDTIMYYFIHNIFKESMFIKLYDNLNIATPFPKTVNPRYYLVPPVIQYVLLIFYLYIQQAQLHAKGIAGSFGGQSNKLFLITMNYAQKYDLLFQFFIKIVVNKSEAYFF